MRSGFEAAAAGDLVRFASGFHPAATWNHRNPDRLGGIKSGVDQIVAFLGESFQLTAGTLRPVPQIFMSDGAGHVAVATRISGTRPDGRAFDDTQILLQPHRRPGHLRRPVRRDPDAVTAFWARRPEPFVAARTVWGAGPPGVVTPAAIASATEFLRRS